MKRTTLLTLTGLALAGSAFVTTSALAGGLSLYEISTPDVGLASAGYAAGAQDASTLFKNPAGMSLLDGPQLNSSLQLLYGNVQFSKNNNTSAGPPPLGTPDLGNDSGRNAIGALPGLSLFTTCPVTKKLSVGFGAFSYFGLSEDFGNTWVGRYYAEKATLLGMTLMPAASFKVNDWLSVGGGLNAMYGYLNAQTAVRRLVVGDGQMNINDSVWGFGGNAGIMIQLREGTRIGVNYLSEVKLDFSAKPRFSSNLGAMVAPQLDMGMTVPQSVMVGIYQDINTNWAVMADVGWQQWSRFGEVQVGVNTQNPVNSKDFTTQLHFDDTWHGAIGAQYKASEQWRFTGGFAYDTSAVSDANRALILPIGEAYRFGLGAFCKVSQSVDLGAAYELAWSGNLPVTQGAPGDYRGEVSGSFNDAYIMFFSLNLNWHF
ncbi:MAG: OmpP1/FadL family transporter [Limisphaerales bacterium]